MFHAVTTHLHLVFYQEVADVLGSARVKNWNSYCVLEGHLTYPIIA